MHILGSGRHMAIALVVASALAGPSRAQAPSGPGTQQTYDLCARGLNNNPAKPFTQTLRVKFLLSGPPIDESIRKAVLLKTHCANLVSQSVPVESDGTSFSNSKKTIRLLP